jgi:multidrug efflux pump subunit AcrA (membrane-fusion protein)
VKIAFQAGSRQGVILAKGQRAVWKNSGSGETGDGIVSKLDLSADPNTHLLGGEALFANTGGKLVPGLLVSFDVLTARRRGVIAVPPGCLVESDGGVSIFVAAESEGKLKAVLRKVETGLRTADKVEIVDGLKEGDTVILFGQSKINDGDLVKVVGSRKGD